MVRMSEAVDGSGYVCMCEVYDVLIARTLPLAVYVELSTYRCFVCLVGHV